MDLRKPRTLYTQLGKITLQQRNLQTLEALLDGLDLQLSQKVYHSKRSLQVLDWRDAHWDFWTVEPRAMSAAHSEDASSKEAGKPGLRKKKPTLTILAHLCFEAWSRSCATRDELQLCLLKWARKRKASVHLCCEKMMINSKAVFTILELLRAMQLDSIQELDVFSHWACPSTSQLKSLSLRKFSMKSFNLETLQVLLDKLAKTLETLVLENCDITDSQLLAILPALSRCSQLKTFSCYGNRISLGILQVLLHLCAGLSQLTYKLYPAPLESYDSKIPAKFVHPEQFPWVCAELEQVGLSAGDWIKGA
ncbi:PRAME family member 10-like [Heterocephalus glaber]|uniref:PRAME family member 10-like n=1 Tax=Heterocephalus glaber TaxID=10181 RepID=A0AAX6SJS3_HETGA|nr:PRAME family member 10-like [Heterocephalus glaber]